MQRKDRTRTNPAFPIKVSKNGRYLEDSAGRPFLLFADTCWKLFWEFSGEEAAFYLEDRRQKGFTAIQVQLLPHRDYQANRDGNTPFLTRGDMASPNPHYFDHVASVIATAMEKDMGLIVAPAWASVWEQDWYRHLNLDNADAYFGYLGARFGNCKNLIGWIHGGDDDAIALHDVFRKGAIALKEDAPGQLHMFHANQKGAWTFFHREPWYGINMAYSYDYPTMAGQIDEAYRLAPAKPVFLGETHYEGNDGITGPLIRKFAYASILLGGMGQTYGHKDIWIATCFWRPALDAPGAWHMKHLSDLLSQIPWHRLAPDIAHALVVDGYRGHDAFAPAACSEDGSLAIVYIPDERMVAVNTTLLDEDISACWFDPTCGRYWECVVEYGTSVKFMTPGRNSAGDGDWVLLFTRR